MSLYLYVVAVTDEKAVEWEQYVTHARSLGIFTDHRCSTESGCIVPDLAKVMYREGMCLGRPMYNSGASEMESWYGKQTIGENEFTIALTEVCRQYSDTEYGPDGNWLEWLRKHRGQTVIVCNDNEVG